MARGRVPGKSKAVEEATEDATKQVTPAPPFKKSKGNEESTGKKLVKITIEHCNSSQKFKGQSLNKSWEMGPDVLNGTHGVLIRFWGDYIGRKGDMSKMFY